MRLQHQILTSKWFLSPDKLPYVPAVNSCTSQEGSLMALPWLPDIVFSVLKYPMTTLVTTSEVRAVCFNVLSLGQVCVCILQIVHTIGFVCSHFIFSCIDKTVSLSVYKSRVRDLTFVHTVYLSPMGISDCCAKLLQYDLCTDVFAQSSVLVPTAYRTLFLCHTYMQQ